MKLKTSRICAAIIAALGLTAALAPKYIFPICESSDLSLFSSYQPIMRCFWFARAEIILGGLVVLAGVILFVRPTPDSRFTMGMLLAGLGLSIVLVSLTSVIGSTCGHANSICQVGTKPIERIIGGFIVVAGLLTAIFAGKRST